VTVSRPCQFCGLREAWSERSWCRACETYVGCEQCGLKRGAPPEVGICERCRRLNAIELRAFTAAAELVARTDLTKLGGRVVYPFRVPISNVDAARLARAARELQEAMRELQAAPRKGPKRAETPALEVKAWRRGSRK